LEQHRPVSVRQKSTRSFDQWVEIHNELDALLPANWAAANRAAHPVIKSGDSQAA
jgi:hypothetical protein